MFLFGLKMLWEAWKMKPEEAEELQQEVQDEIQQRRRGSSGAGSHEMEECQQERSGDGDKEEESGNNARGEEEEEGLAAAATGAPLDPEARRESELRRSSRIRFREKSVFGKKCYKILKLFVNCFTMTFLAEWGDRSQLATIVLASVNDVAGVCIGGVLGHSICTGLAVIAGAIIAKKISPRIVTFVGAVVFLLYAVASLFYDPESQEMIKIDI